jgi:hypothetical protein
VILAAILVALLPVATVRGTVRAEGTQEPVAYASVRVDDARRTARTDQRGLFVLPDVPEGSWRVRVSAVGYQPMDTTVRVPASGTLELSFSLRAAPFTLPGIEARGRQESRAASTAGPGATRIEAREIDAAPALAEADVLRTVQLLPSVATASDFSSALYVRGGSPDQTMVMLDGTPIFNPYHLGGLFGAIDPDAVGAVDVLPGAFPARVGDRLSGVIDIQTRDGGRDRVRGFGGTSLISTRAGVEGPLPGGRGSYLLTGRRTYLDLFTRAAYGAGLIDATLPYHFTDGHLKLTHDVGKLGRLSAAFYVDEERMGYPRSRPSGDIDVEPLPGNRVEDDVDFAWGSRVGSLRFRRPLGPTVVAELRGAVSTFHGTFDVSEGRYVGEGKPDTLAHVLGALTRMRDVMAGADIAWHARNHQVRGGLQWDAYRFHHDLDEHEDNGGPFVSTFRRTDEPRTLAAYLEDEWQASPLLRVRGGVRVLSAGERGTEILPRLGAQYTVTPSLTLSLGGGRSAQVLHSLRSEESLGASLMAYDLLAAVPASTGLSTATDLVGGAEWVRGTTSVRVDAFAKRLANVPVPPLPGDITEAPVLVNEGFVAADGDARGVELLARHTRGRAMYSLAYSLNDVKLDVGGVRYTPRYERRHTMDAVAMFPWGRRGEVSSRLAMASGQPYTPAMGFGMPLRYDPSNGAFVQYGSGGSVLLGEHNTGRLPGYFRLDVGFRRSYEPRIFGRQTTVTPFLQILNVLNTPNVLAGVPQVYGEAGPQVEYAPQLPILPTIGFEWKF